MPFAGLLHWLGRAEGNIFGLLIFTAQFLSAEVFMETDGEGETYVGPCRGARCVQMSEVLNVCRQPSHSRSWLIESEFKL